MPSPLLRRACATALGGALTIALLSGGVPSPRLAPVPTSSDLVHEAASAALVKSSAIRCAGDSTSAPPKKSLVAYRSLSGGTFAARAVKAGGKVLQLGRGSLLLQNFHTHAATWDAAVIGGTTSGLVGAGISTTTVRMVAHSSTRARQVPTASGTTNQLNVLRVTDPTAVLRGFTLQATAQGHLYNGLRVEKATRLRADHVRVLGIPGNDHQPPGETFAINDWKSRGSQWNHIRIDGRGVGASGFGVNSAKNIRICDAVSKNNPSAMGFAFWQTKGITCTDCRAYDNGFSGFNFERTSGNVTLVRPDARGNRYDMRVASDQRSARFRIVDPKLHDGTWTIWMPRRWFGTTNKQRRSDVTLIVHGKRRNDLLRFRTY